MEIPSPAICAATRTTPTASGDVEVQCGKPAGHEERGDPQHEARIGVFPVRWTATT